MGNIFFCIFYMRRIWSLVIIINFSFNLIQSAPFYPPLVMTTPKPTSHGNQPGNPPREMWHPIIRSASKVGNYAVPRGSTVRMSCIPPKVVIDESKVYGEKSFTWTDEDDKEIANPRKNRLKTGELQIIRAHEDDSGVYHCKYRQAFRHNGTLSRIFVHKLIVYELSGHKFETVVAFDITQSDSETTITLLRALLKNKICGDQLCTPGDVTSEKCEIMETEAQMCSMVMTYKAVEPAQTPKCDERCVRKIMLERLKKAEKQLDASLLEYSENSQSRLKPDMQSFDTRHIITCKAGYHLIKSTYEHCFPCLPGTYSEAESLTCDQCPVGFYQEKYGSQGCERCLGYKTTAMVGSKSRDECRPLTETGFLKDIKDSIGALFTG